MATDVDNPDGGIGLREKRVGANGVFRDAFTMHSISQPQVGVLRASVTMVEEAMGTWGLANGSRPKDADRLELRVGS